MKHLVTLVVVLGLAAGANAQLFTEDFSAPAGWTITGTTLDISGGTAFWDVGGDTNSQAAKTVALGVQSDLVVTWDQRTHVTSTYSPGYLLLEDAEGDLFELGMGTSWTAPAYFDGACFINDPSGAGDWEGGWADVMVATTDNWFTREVVIAGIGTTNGSFTVNGLAVTDNDGGGSGSGTVFDFSEVGEIVSITLDARKNFEVDNIEIDVPEPASLALLGMGGLALLRRRR